MSIPYKINTSKSSRVQFVPNGPPNENIFVSLYFLILCGFTQNQLDTIGGYSVEHDEKYFNLNHLVGYIANTPYCPNLEPLSNIGIETDSLGSGVHNFTGDTSRLLCSIQNDDNQYSITNQFKNPIWFDASKISGRTLHIRISSNNHTQKEIETKISKLVLHIELQIMDVKEKRELIFAKLSRTTEHSGSNQSFLGRLSHSIKINEKNAISLKCVTTGGFANILPEDRDVEIIKFVENIEQKIKVKIIQTTFKSHQDFIKCLNITFEGYKIKFTQRKKHLTIINESSQNIVINPSPAVNQIFGHDGLSIKLVPSRIHTFSRIINLCFSIPKILSIRSSLGSNNGFVELVDSHQNIVFLTDCQNPTSLDLKDKYSHTPGLFDYIRLTFSDLLEKKFEINDYHIYISFVIENHE